MPQRQIWLSIKAFPALSWEHIVSILADNTSDHSPWQRSPTSGNSIPSETNWAEGSLSRAQYIHQKAKFMWGDRQSTKQPCADFFLWFQPLRCSHRRRGRMKTLCFRSGSNGIRLEQNWDTGASAI